MKYIVLKVEDVPGYAKDDLVKVIGAVMKKRKDAGKEGNNTYFVVNADEPYAQEVRDIIIREHGECSL